MKIALKISYATNDHLKVRFDSTVKTPTKPVIHL